MLMDRVMAGEMSREEAYRRNNYYRFVERCSGIDAPVAYVLDTPADELPPLAIEVYDSEAALDIWEGCAQMVEDGYLTAYEGAEEYYWAVKG